jgi:hypothetical protein
LRAGRAARAGRAEPAELPRCSRRAVAVPGRCCCRCRRRSRSSMSAPPSRCLPSTGASTTVGVLLAVAHSEAAETPLPTWTEVLRQVRLVRVWRIRTGNACRTHNRGNAAQHRNAKAGTHHFHFASSDGLTPLRSAALPSPRCEVPSLFRGVRLGHGGYYIGCRRERWSHAGWRNCKGLHLRSSEWVPPAGFEPAAFCSGGRRSIP